MLIPILTEWANTRETNIRHKRDHQQIFLCPIQSHWLPLSAEKNWFVSITFSSRDNLTEIWSNFLSQFVIWPFCTKVVLDFRSCSLPFYCFSIVFTPHFSKTLDFVWSIFSLHSALHTKLLVKYPKSVKYLCQCVQKTDFDSSIVIGWT